ncbi:putative sugar lactone lactonase YvrE [Cylas formicarius]|uniref:putative sugar lactone lactonase YvrE n=1 Tax=Cylas formicarius TaxID=197179 RepID=UPI002958D711|nr:putative sugar lactone lactonase YvrE [Cylas formicarius]
MMFKIVSLVLLVPYIQCSKLLQVKQITDATTMSDEPFWDKYKQVLYYLDLDNRLVFQWNYRTGATTSTKIYEESIGVVIPVKGHPTHFVVATGQDILLMDWDGRDNTGRLKIIPQVGELKAGEIFGHGKADAKGRLWVGAYKVRNDSAVDFVEGEGALYCVTFGKNQTAHIEKKLDNLTHPTGLLWSHGDDHFFLVDYPSKKVMKYSFDLQEGELGTSSVLIDLEDHPEFNGEPDGLADGPNHSLSLTLSNGSAILHIDTITGEVLDFLTTPTPLITDFEWGGPHNDIAFYTTSSTGLSKAYLDKNVFDSGAVFSIERLGVQARSSYPVILP